MCDLTEDDVSPKSDGKDGLSNSERQGNKSKKIKTMTVHTG